MSNGECESPSDTVPRLTVGTGWIPLEVIGEPELVLTVRGYSPLLPVRKLSSGVEYRLLIAAKSLGDKLEPLRFANAGRFEKLAFQIKRESTERTAKYELKSIDDTASTS